MNPASTSNPPGVDPLAFECAFERDGFAIVRGFWGNGGELDALQSQLDELGRRMSARRSRRRATATAASC